MLELVIRIARLIWGGVFSDQTVDNLRRNDPVSAKVISAEFAHWDDIKLKIRGEVVRYSGHGFIGIGRKRMLAILQDRARDLGANLFFEHEFGSNLAEYADYDLVIAADGVNSRLRERYADHFKPDIQTRANKVVWLGTTKNFDAFTFSFKQTPHGWIWMHAYRFEDAPSTFIIECSQSTEEGLGFDTTHQAATAMSARGSLRVISMAIR